jgi:hypothetical protein
MAEARQLGLSPEALADLGETLQVQSRADEGCDVWLENWPIVQAFLTVATQWRVAAIGGGFAPSMLVFVGLDYASVRVALDALAIEVTPELWRGLRIMEAEACAALNEADR